MYFSLLLAIICSISSSLGDDKLVIKVNENTSTAKIPPHFASFGWEMWGMMGYLGDLGDERYINIASHLSPAVVRVGGITADWVRYTGVDESSSSNEVKSNFQSKLGAFWPNAPNNISITQIETLATFLKKAKLSLLFDLNELYGRNCNVTKPGTDQPDWCTGTWDTSNVRSLLQYMHDKKLVGGENSLFAFELGNELVSHMYAATTAADIIELAGIIQKIWSDVPYSERPGLYAPSNDACFDSAQLKVISDISKIPGVLGYTYHAYPASSGEGKMALSKLLMNSTWLRTGILTGSDSIACINAWNEGPRASGLELWITEASSSWNWQLPSPAQDSFLHGFFTIPQLGQYASTGIPVVGRWAFSEQSPFGTIRKSGSGWEVAHDYWVIVTHKRTVGTKVLSVSGDEKSDVLVYAYCGQHNNGSITVTAVNVGSSAASVRFTTSSGAEIPSSPRSEYVFTAPKRDIGSISPVLNGDEAKPLRINEDGSLPANFQAAYVDDGKEIMLPPLSQAFYQLLMAKVPACG